jgi:FdhD protein
MTQGKVEEVKIVAVRQGTAEEVAIPVVREVPLTVSVNGKELLTLVTTGDANRELALGFLLSEGFIRSKEDLVSVREDEEAGSVEVELSGDLSAVEKLWEKRTITSGCGKGSTFYHVLDSLQAGSIDSGFSVTMGSIQGLMRELNQRSELYRETRGVHNSALADGERLLIFRDDIGRHNAVDKIRGACFVEDIPLEDKMIVTTGRLSSEIVIKVAKMGVPVLVSRSAPTSLAIELAGRVGLTMVGYARGEKMNIYTGSERVIL